ncbi:hypothetical protein GOP47_0023865 [Adiantum capillus-veneris]|uniref:Acid phosphatase n=1 Tax=Adiantum capillus-veneris TaxID=13818 RepID=A0A9D4Z4Z7_ADICA|nr:hypothetical protein GOP47_0023865 [Adiantum capillus-veneris]
MASSSVESEQDPEPDEPTFRFDQNNTSSQSLLSGGGSGYESQYGSLFGTIAVVGIVLVAAIITLAVMLSSCGQNSTVNVQFKRSADFCSSFRLNIELNNMQGRALPGTCDAEIFEYVHGGQYIKDVEMAVNSARHYLKSLVLEDNQSFGVILDIDETALSNVFLYQNGGYRSKEILDESFGRRVNTNTAAPLLPVLDLYRELRAANWSIFFVSERPESALKLTVQNLLDSGYEGWRGLFLRSAGDSESTVQAFKSNNRIEIEKQGYQILCALGDQWSDIVGPATG